MSQRPDVRRHRGDLLGRELRATHRGHGAAIVLRSRDTAGDGLLDPGEAAVAPRPLARREIRSERTAFAIRAMTTGARSATDLAREDLLAERHGLQARTRGHGERRHITRILVQSFRR